MTVLGQYHPEGEVAERMGALPGVRFTPGMVFSVEKEHIGPEGAGAVLLLQNTLDTAEKAQQFWSQADHPAAIPPKYTIPTPELGGTQPIR